MYNFPLYSSLKQHYNPPIACVATAGCCASSSMRDGSPRSSWRTCCPCPGPWTCYQQTSDLSTRGACGLGRTASWPWGRCGWRCGMGQQGGLRRICMWSPGPPSKSSALGGPCSDGPLVPRMGKRGWVKKKNKIV